MFKPSKGFADIFLGACSGRKNISRKLTQFSERKSFGNRRFKNGREKEKWLALVLLKLVKIK